MSARSPAEPAALPALPHWEQPPPDLPDAISQVKTALRARIAASGRTVEQVMGVVERQLRADVAEIARLNILHASLLAMRRAVAKLPSPPDHALVDGNMPPKLTCGSRTGNGPERCRGRDSRPGSSGR